MTRTPSVAYCQRIIQTTPKQELYDTIDQIPMLTKDFVFLSDIIEGLDNEALAAKHKKSPSRISQWKRSVYEKIHRYMIAQDQKARKAS